MPAGGGGVIPGEDGVEEGAEDAVCGGFEALVVVGDHQLDAREAAVAERAEEVQPEGLGFGGADLHAEQLAVAIRPGRRRR